MRTNKHRIEFDPIELDVPSETFRNEEDTKRWIWENCGDSIVAGMNWSDLQASSGENQAKAAFQSIPWTQDSKQVELESRIKHLQAENSRLRENELVSRKAASAQLRYFACMSHEIRTPLSCIIGLSKMLLDMDLEPQQEEYMKMIVSSSDLLLAVVNDVLDWSKLETGSYNVLMRESNLQEVLDSTVRSIQMQAHAKQVRLATFYDASLPETFTTDSRRLQQILYNLLGNAIKFNKKEGVVKLSVMIVDNPSTEGLLETLLEEEHETKSPEVKNSKGLTLTGTIFSNLWARSSQESLRLMGALSSSSLSDIIDESMAESSVSSGTACRYQNTMSSFSQNPSIRFEITDYGIGIKEEDIDRIFLPFHQESPETESTFGGTGLGLTITYKLVQALGGSIKVESKVGEFTRFIVDLPFADNRVVDVRSAALPNTKVLLISEPDHDDASYAAALHTFTEYGIAFDVLPNLTSAVDDLCTKRAEATADQFICLFQEDLFQVDCIEQLKERHIPLISFGPKHTVQTVDAHIMSIEQTLPCVLVKTLRNSMLQNAESRISSKSSSSLSLKSGISTNATRNLRVLIAEDNAINQKILSQMLVRLGLRDVDIVDNGEKAIEIESANEYDLIFMDALMPKVDGVQACKAIQGRKRHGHPTPYIVFVTAYISTEFNENCQMAGGDEVLTKPYHVEEICASMARAAATRNRPSISSAITAI